MKTLKTLLKKSLSLLMAICFVSQLAGSTANAQTETKIKKHRISEQIVYCISSEYDEEENIYISTIKTENDNLYCIYSDDNIENNWFVAIVDDLANNDVEDDEIIDLYLLDEYEFND